MLLIQLFYIFSEYFYNQEILGVGKVVLDNLNSPAVLQGFLQNLELLGHLLSATGFTLITYNFLPKSFILKKKLIASAIIFSSFYISLNILMNSVIASQAEHRADNYYKALAQEGYLASWLPVKQPESEYQKMLVFSAFFNFPVEDAEALVRENKEHLYGHVLRIKRRELEAQYNKFTDFADSAMKDWMDFEDVRQKLYGGDTQKAKKYLLHKFNSIIDRKYAEYNQKMKPFYVQRDAIYKKLDTIYFDLTKYFKYRGNKIAEEKYANSMKEHFGVYIEPDTWCEDDGWGNVSCPDYQTMKEVIDIEIMNRLQEKTDIPLLESRSEFISYFRKDIIKTIREHGINIPDNISLTKSGLSQYISQEINEKYALFVDKVKAQMGEGFDVNWSYEEYVNSGFFTEIAEKYIPSQFVENAREMFLEKDFSKSYEKLIIPIAKSKVEETVLLSKEDIEKRHPEYGDRAVQMLYVIPFALFMSALSIFLNLINMVKLATTTYFQKYSKKATYVFIGATTILSLILSVDLTILTESVTTTLFSFVGGFERILGLFGGSI